MQADHAVLLKQVARSGAVENRRIIRFPINKKEDLAAADNEDEFVSINLK